MEARTGALTNPDEIRWTLEDPADPSKGERAHLFGDVEASGVYAFRIRLRGGSAGGRPHWHPEFELGTVLEGILYVATGRQPRRSSAKKLYPGAFIVIPPTVRHALWAEEDVTLQIVGPGPRTTKFDDPL